MNIANSKNINKDNYSPSDYENWGFIYLENKEFDQALKCFQKTIELEPHNPKNYIHLGHVYEKMDMLDSAKISY